MFKALKDFIFIINVFLVAVLFLIIFLFSTYLHNVFVQKEALKQSNIIANQVFSSMYQVMKRGWTRAELNDFTSSLKNNFNGTEYTINIYRAGSVNELFGFVTEGQKDSTITKAFSSGEQINIFSENTLRNIKPIIASNECLSCHINTSIGDTLGVIDIKHNMTNNFNKMLIDYIVFFIIILPVFILIAYIVSRYTTKKISKSLATFNSQVISIHSIKEFKNFSTKELDLGFSELNDILKNVDLLAEKLKGIAVDKEILEFEVQLLDKFIITSDIIKDWKQHISELLVDINKVMETYSLMTIFRVGDDRFEVDIFWHGVPEKQLVQSVEEYIFHSINTNLYLGDIIDPIINHNIANNERCLASSVMETLEHQTKTLFLDTPKIGGIVGISVQSDIVVDPIKHIVIDSILTTLANLVGSIKAINKYTHDLEFYASHDPLTELFNQRVFNDMLQYGV